MNDQFNPHIENLRQAVAITARTDPGGAAVCRAGLEFLAERLHQLEADNLMLLVERTRLREACEAAESHYAIMCEVMFRDSPPPQAMPVLELLRAALSCQQEPKPQ